MTCKRCTLLGGQRNGPDHLLGSSRSFKSQSHWGVIRDRLYLPYLLPGPRDFLFASSSVFSCGRPRPAASSCSGESRGGCSCLWSALQPHGGAGRTRRTRDGRGSRIFWKGAVRSATRALKVGLPASWALPSFPLFPVFVSSWAPVPSQPRIAQAWSHSSSRGSPRTWTAADSGATQLSTGRSSPLES